MDWSYEQCHHRRGDFAALNFGVSHGQGPKAPYRLAQDTKALEELVQRLLNDPDIQRLAISDSGKFHFISLGNFSS